MQNGKLKFKNAANIVGSSPQMLQIACGKESSKYKVLQIAFKVKGFSSKMLQMACKL